MKKSKEGYANIYVPIVSAVVWGAVIIGCSLALKGTGYYKEISNILYGGVIAHVVIIWPMAVLKLGKKH